MRTLSLAASAQLATKMGVEPLILVQVEIPNNYVYVSDKDVTRGGIHWAGKITQLGQIITEQRTDLVGSVSSVQVALSDADDVFRNRLKTERWQSRKVKIFHSFGTLDEMFLVFAGKVSTPFNWSEQEHTFSFECVSDFNSQPAGIEIVDDQFQGAVSGGGVPLAFGTIINSCPVRIYENVNAKVATPFVKTVTLIAVPESSVYASNPDHSWANSPYQAQYGNYLYKSNGFYIADNSTYTSSFDVDNASKFPQDTPIALSASNFLGKIEGSFHGNTFTVTRLNDLIKTLQFGDVVDQSHNGARPSYITVKDSDLFDYTYSVLCFNTTNTLGEKQQVKCYVLSVDYANNRKIYLGDDPPETWSSIEVRVPQFNPSGDLFSPTQYTVLPAGATIYLDDNGIIEAYAFTALPYTNLKVLGYQIVNGKKFLCELPSQFYALEPNFQGLGITAIALSKKLSAYNISISAANFKLDWGENFYVSFQSSVGSNVVDVIKYIFEHYTNFVVDSVSFNTVRALVVKYPVNFVTKGTPEILSLISDICYQARLGLTIKNGLVYIKYLSKEPDAVAQITDDEIAEGTFDISYTDESKLRTQLTAKFEVDCIDHLPRKRVYKNNVSIYGLLKEEKSYFITTDDKLITKSNTFWGNRISNQWKIIKFKTFLTTLAIEQGDCVYIRSEYYTGKALVDKYDYDTLANEASLELWTPVVAGTDVQSPLAWLSDGADVAPIALTIYAPPPQVYTITLPVSNYGVHDKNTLTGTITANEDQNTAPFTADDGTTGTATNLNSKSKVKTGDKVIIVKDKFGKYNMQASGGDGGSTPVEIISIDADGVNAIVNVYVDGFDKPPTDESAIAKLVVAKKDLVVPCQTVADYDGSTYLIDLSTPSYIGTVTSVVDSDGKFRAQLTAKNGSTFSVSVNAVNSKPVIVGQDVKLSHDSSGALSHDPNTHVAGGDADTLVVDGRNPSVAPTATVGDVHRVSSDGYLTIDLDNASLSTAGGAKVPLSDIFQIVNGKLCIKTTANMTDGTVVAKQELVVDPNDTAHFRPASTLLKD